ncbi:hypothetical protein CcCBS67573_g00051 [Chytriomyces confervae]|uniref:J domain-containing protein n=1 Tax=Chytriomyces confervae TaxID=246404 RepID=A0A507FQU7_9FUNG|nr:hypothetical protein CcCBS67573_g00051 [Chytriomyces confervae]
MFVRSSLLRLRRLHSKAGDSGATGSGASPLPWKHRQSPYALLGVKKGCPPKEVKTRYFELSFKHHPDKNLAKPAVEQEAKRKEFMAIQDAYEVLKDDMLRREYDTFGGSFGGGGLSPTNHANTSGGFRVQEEGTQPEGEFKIFRPWLYGVFFFLGGFVFLTRSMVGRREEMRDQAWNDWYEARRKEGQMTADQDLLIRRRLIALQRQRRKEREGREDTERRRAVLASSSGSGNANEVVLIDSDPETDTDSRAQRGSGLREEVDLTVANVGSRSAAPLRVAHLAPASSTASSSVSTSAHHSPVSVDSDSDGESVHDDGDVVFVGSSRPIVQPPPPQAPSHQYHRSHFSVNSVFNDMFAILSPHARHPDIRYDPYPMRQPSPPPQKPPPRPRVIVLQPSG